MYNDKKLKLIYFRNIDMIYRIAYTFFKGDIKKIEDAIQSVFSKLLEKRIKFKNIEHEKIWFVVSIKNICENILKEKRNTDIEFDYDVDYIFNNNSLLDMILNLPDKYKLPFYLYYYEGFSCNDIAKMFNISENTIFSYLNKARKILLIELEIGK